MATWLWLGWRSPTRTETKVDKVIWRNGFLKQFQVQTLPNTSWCNWRSLVGFRLRCFTFSLWYMRLRKMEAAGRRVWCPMHWCLFNSCADKITDNTSSRAAKCSIRKSSWSENFRRNAFEVLRSETCLFNSWVSLDSSHKPFACSTRQYKTNQGPLIGAIVPHWS